MASPPGSSVRSFGLSKDPVGDCVERLEALCVESGLLATCVDELEQVGEVLASGGDAPRRSAERDKR